MEVSRFDVVLVRLDPTVGSEIKKTRPCLVLSPNDMNRALRTVIVAPMTTQAKRYPCRVLSRFQGTNGYIVLDQIRTIDKARVVKKLGRLSRKTSDASLSVLREIFS